MKQFDALPVFNEKQQAIDDAVNQTRRALASLTDGWKDSASERGVYLPVGNQEWTAGFWTGELNLAYTLSGDPLFLDAVRRQIPSFLDRIVRRVDVDHHDMGFLYSPSCVAFSQETGDEMACQAALLAADNLVSRFQEKGQFIQAWGPMGQPENYRLIVDCLMNLPLLFWAYAQTGKARYQDVAARHLHTALSCVLRPDDSTYHTFYFDTMTGKPLYGRTAQGNRDDSAWARGQAWAVYGSAVAYRHMKDPLALDVFHRALAFFLNHLPASIIPYWDFDFSDGSGQPRDSSALAITICGMQEMAGQEPDGSLARELSQTSDRLLRILWKECAVTGVSVSNGQLLHGTYAKKSPWNTVTDRGVDECTSWGDYFYMEALRRSQGGWISCW